MNAVIFHPEAREEYFSSIDFYNEHTPDLGTAFIEEIERSISIISGHPKRWKIIKKGVRKYNVHRFPFSILYVIDSNVIYIVAIAHSKRNPDYWDDRI
jgi:mRNA-degrading endonuclease RelE of RelBE toxin-antitoxin system